MSRVTSESTEEGNALEIPTGIVSILVSTRSAEERPLRAMCGLQADRLCWASHKPHSPVIQAKVVVGAP